VFSHPVVSYPTVMHMQRIFSQNASDFHHEGPEELNFVNIPSSNFHNNGLFKPLHERCINYILSNSIKESVFLISITYCQMPPNMKTKWIKKIIDGAE